MITTSEPGTSPSLPRKDQRADLATLIKRVVEGYRFLSNLTELESKLANDKTGKAQAEADRLTQELRPTPQGGVGSSARPCLRALRQRAGFHRLQEFAASRGR